MNPDATPSWSASPGTNVKPPLQVEGADAVAWDEQVDVLVVGLGGAGACAAIEAREQGATVMVAERFSGGGATTLSGGIVYTGGGTPQQTEAGVEDSTEGMLRYLRMETRDIVNDDTLRDFCEQSIPNLRWLEEQGVRFSGKLYAQKTSYPPPGYGLYYSGNEKVREYAAEAPPAPRGHRADGDGMSGEALYQPLAERTAAAGADIQCHTEVTRLIVDSAGDVLGAELQRLPASGGSRPKQARLERRYRTFHARLPPIAEHCQRSMARLEETSGREVLRVRARGGVVLAAGGFAQNPQLVEKYAPAYAPALPIGGAGCSGAGIELGQSVGGAVGNMDRISGWRFINPPALWTRGIVVNTAGERFVSEQVYGAQLTDKLREQPEGRAYLILDSQLFWKSFREVFSGKLWIFRVLQAIVCALFNNKRARTVAKLARKLKIDADGLASTVAAYNESAASGNDPLGKSPDGCQALTGRSFYGMDLRIDNPRFPCAYLPLGGLRVDEHTGHVLRQDGSRIEGLLAAGRNALGIPSNGYVSGLSLADCVYSGRRAGRCAALATAGVQAEASTTSRSQPNA